MNQYQVYAKELVNRHGKAKALQIAQSSLVATNSTPNTYYFNEAAWYMDKDGRLQLGKDQKKFAGVREKRLKSTINFWTQVLNLVKKV